MMVYNQIQIAAPFEVLFQTAADIARWPEILPHYRWVVILNRQGPNITAEMAARHKGLPIWWKTIQTPLPDERKIHFTHIGGITKGMEVDWIFEEVRDAGLRARKGEVWDVQIRHEFNPQWPPGGQWVADTIIGKMFVQQVAQKTLKRIKQIMEIDSIPHPNPLPSRERE